MKVFSAIHNAEIVQKFYDKTKIKMNVTGQPFEVITGGNGGNFPVRM